MSDRAPESSAAVTPSKVVYDVADSGRASRVMKSLSAAKCEHVHFMFGPPCGHCYATDHDAIAQAIAEARAAERERILSHVRSVAEFELVEASELPMGAAYGRAGLESASAYNVAKVRAAAINEAADAAEVAATLATRGTR